MSPSVWNYKGFWVLPLLHKFTRIVKRSSSRWCRFCVLYDLRIQCKVATGNYQQRIHCIKLNLQQNLQNPFHITTGKLRGKVYKDSMCIKLSSDWLTGWLLFQTVVLVAIVKCPVRIKECLEFKDFDAIVKHCHVSIYYFLNVEDPQYLEKNLVIVVHIYLIESIQLPSTCPFLWQWTTADNFINISWTTITNLLLEWLDWVYLLPSMTRDNCRSCSFLGLTQYQ